MAPPVRLALHGRTARDAVARWFATLPAHAPLRAVDFCDVELVRAAVARRALAVPYVVVVVADGDGAVAVHGWRRGPDEHAELETAHRGDARTPLLRPLAAPRRVAPLYRSLYARHAERTDDDDAPVLVRGEHSMHAYLDAMLEIYEMLEYEELRADSAEFVRRLNALHARIFECDDDDDDGAVNNESAAQRERTAWRALAWLVFLYPQLGALVRATLGHLLLFRYDWLLAGERRLVESYEARSAAFPYPYVVAHGRNGGHTYDDDDDADADEALRALCAQLALDVAAQRTLVARALARHARRWPHARAPLYVYLVSVQRDAYDVWRDNADGDGRDAVECRNGLVWLTYADLPRALTRQRQRTLGDAVDALMRATGATTRLDGIDADARHAHSPLARLSDVAIERYAATAARHALARRDLDELAAHARRTQQRTVAVALARRGAPRRLAVALVHDLDELARRALARLALVRERVRCEAEARRGGRGSAAVDAACVPRGVELTATSLAQHAALDMPPCHARLVLRALGASKTRASAHPRYLERIRLSQFLFQAGWTLERAMAAWYELFAADGTARYANLGAFREQSPYARTLVSLHRMYHDDDDDNNNNNNNKERADDALQLDAASAARSLSSSSERRTRAAGCARLSDVCPMREAQRQDGDLGYVPDIETLLQPPSSGTPADVTPLDEARCRCARVFVALHPGRAGDSRPIAHPNEYYERALTYRSTALAHHEAAR